MKKRKIRVLDKGFVRLLELTGGDEAAVLSARVSYAKGLSDAARDRRLIDYLMKNQHLTPFEHAVFRFHVSCPIFVARQWFRHRMGSFSEWSLRFSQTPDAFYIPGKLRAPDLKNKQASRISARLDHERGLSLIRQAQETCYRAYRDLLSMGVAREISRIVLPMSLYTQFHWTVNARSLMNFMSLRADIHAQWEMREYARALAEIFSKEMPWTWESFLRHSWKGKNPKLDAQRKKCLQKKLP